jgi:hypothetical protein
MRLTLYHCILQPLNHEGDALPLHLCVLQPLDHEVDTTTASYNLSIIRPTLYHCTCVLQPLDYEALPTLHHCVPCSVVVFTWHKVALIPESIVKLVMIFQ